METTLRAREPDTIAVDGRTSQHSRARSKDHLPLHTVSAWAARQRVGVGTAGASPAATGASRTGCTARSTSHDDVARLRTGIADMLAMLVLPVQAPVLTLSASTVVIWALIAVILAAPYFFAGCVVSLALTRSPFPVGHVYGVDLVGASTGCLLVLLLLNMTDTPSAIVAVAITASAGA